MEIWILVESLDIFHQGEAITYAHTYFVIPDLSIAEIRTCELQIEVLIKDLWEYKAVELSFFPNA